MVFHLGISMNYYNNIDHPPVHTYNLRTGGVQLVRTVVPLPLSNNGSTYMYLSTLEINALVCPLLKVD